MPDGSPSIMRKNLVIHPFLFALFPLFHLFDHNKYILQLHQTLIPLGLTLGVTFLINAVLVLTLKDKNKAGILTTMTMIIVFSAPYGGRKTKM